MSITKSHCLVLATFVIVGTMMLGDHSVYAQCGADIPALVSECVQYVLVEGPKVPPSPECCQEVKVLDVPCACKLLTPDIEKLISPEKLVYVGRTCGLTIQPGMKCGSYTVPPSA